jgi:hypothetical protein
LKLDPLVYRHPAPVDPPGEVILPREALIRIENAERLLGYRSIVSTPDALEQTLAWARYAELLPHAPAHLSPPVYAETRAP